LQRTEALLNKYTKDYLKLKHDSLQRQRLDKQHIEAMRLQCDGVNQSMWELKEEMALEVRSAHTGAKLTSEQYVALFRQQVCDTERTMGLLKDQHHGFQQALAMRVQELEELLTRLRTQYRELEGRRRLEVEGFVQELALMHKQLSRIELRVYGRRSPLGPESLVESNMSDGAISTNMRVEKATGSLGAMKTRMAALEHATFGGSGGEDGPP